jgi:hypothetical protein
MEELTNYDIEEIAPLFKIKLICCDDYHNIFNYPFQNGSYILNLGNKHWTCLYIKDNQGVYFDSYGEIYPTPIKNYCSNIIYNDDIIQALNTKSCGYYCLYFLYWMTNKFKYNLHYTLNNFRAKFSDDAHKNDKLLQGFIKNIL